MTIGYSGTPLVTKLGIKPGMRVLVQSAPRPYDQVVADLPPSVNVVTRASKRVDLVHLFVMREAGLQTRLVKLRTLIQPDGAIWVSWPKKAAGVATDVTEDVVRAAALAARLVDVKVCAVDVVWSGLKLVIRVRDRA